MNWYQGNIAEAVALSKAKNAIFVVYIEGKDEVTRKLTNFLNETKIKTRLESEDFVAIKIESESQAYMQFAKIYQMVPVPSIFFIGSAGTPLDVGTGVIASSEELEKKIEKVLAESGKSIISSSSSSTSFIAAEKFTAEVSTVLTPSDQTLKTESEAGEIVCDGDVCYKETATGTLAKTQPEDAHECPKSANDAAEVSAPIEETRHQLEQQRRELQEIEEKRRQRIEKEKEQEINRKREARDTQQSQSWQHEQELKDLKDNIRREKLEEQAARERIRAQIAGDRAERTQKTAQQAVKFSENVANSPAASTATQPNTITDSARLQFRLSTGANKMQTFKCQDTLSIVRNYVQEELIPGTGIRDFILATSYPKREFSAEHDDQTLEQLELFPTAVILVIGKESRANPARIIARSGGILNILTTLFWTLLTPVFAVFGYFKNLGARNAEDANTGAQKRANEEQSTQQDAAKRRNLDRYMNGPSTSEQSGSNAAAKLLGGSETDAQEAKPYRRYVGGSNIHRLTDKRKDSDDENATWNGNSTQQQ